MISLADTAGGVLAIGVGLKIYTGLVYSGTMRNLESNIHTTKEALGKAYAYLTALSNS